MQTCPTAADPDRDRVSQFTALQALQLQVRVWERADWSELGSRAWECGVQLPIDISDFPPSVTNFTGEKKYLQFLGGGTPPFLPVFTHSANCAMQAGPRHNGVKPRPSGPPELLREMFPPCQTAGGP